jgi:hypothetical protein
MRSKFKVFITLLIIVFTSVIFTRKASSQQPYVSFQVFYDELSPYGEWVNYPNLGYVWIPDAGPDFTPYSTQGHWIFTNYGWTWVSDYIWGWAPFHYGRWDYDNYYGWLWVPDSEWGPAWVTWRRASGYYGWAPMRPGITLSLSFGRGYDNNNDHWIFVRDRYLDRADINRYYVSRSVQDRIGRRSSVINNTYRDSRRNETYVTGPARSDFQKASGRQVNPLAIQEYNRPGQELGDGHFNIYRPEVRKNIDNGQKYAPSRITDLKDVKHRSERNANNHQNLNNNNTMQPQKANPPKNLRSNRQQSNVKPQKANPPQNLRSNKQQVNVMPQKANPPQNLRSNKQQVDVKPQKAYPPQNLRSNKQQVDVKPQKANPPQNLRSNKQQSNLKQKEINSSNNTSDKKTSTTAKSTKESKKEKRKKSNEGRKIR